MRKPRVAKVLAPSPPLGTVSLVPRPLGLPGHLAGSPLLYLVFSYFICEIGSQWNLPEGVVRIHLHKKGKALGTVPALRRASCHSHLCVPSQVVGKPATRGLGVITDPLGRTVAWSVTERNTGNQRLLGS